ncbi:MAG: CHAT domain-containing protein [Cyanobacteria bacterium P01_D01_bin.156]
MVRLFNRHHTAALLITFISPVALVTTAQAQSITSADNATTVQQIGDQYQIDGGNVSGDSTTLIHSFDQFGLLTGESAQFSNPATIENIIGRITGGDASIIDGLLAVDGNANLYLLNPSGIFFGENTQLNLAGSFSASTATGLNFGDELLDTLGTNDYASLTGAPTGYEFATETGALINAGDLAVTSGQSLTLLGGQVINTGQLSGGEVLVMAVPGENRVRLSQSGSLLGLELETLPNAAPTADFTASTVPALLTGAGDLGMATDITVNADGSVSLSGSSLQIPMEEGTAVISGQLTTDGGNVGILGEQIALVDATLDASGDAGGGTVLIGGDDLGNGTVPNAAATVIDENSVVLADARDAGNGGKIVAWGTNLLRSAGQLFARGGVNGGDGGFIETSSLGQLEVSATPDVSAVNGSGGLWLLDPANIRIVAGDGSTNINSTPGTVATSEVITPAMPGMTITDPITGVMTITPGTPETITPATPGTPSIFSSGAAPPESTLGVDLITDALANGTNVEIITTGDTPGDGNIILETPLDYHQTGSNSLSLIAKGEIQILADIFDSELTTFTETVMVTTGPPLIGPDGLPIPGTETTTTTTTITTTESFDDLNLTLEANEQITVTGSINSGEGDINISSLEGDINISNNLTTSGGDVSLSAPQGDIVFDSIDTGSNLASGNGGDVTIAAIEGTVRGIGGPTTIATVGELSDGSITITHGGGLDDTPFTVGDASVNGTAGSIITGETTLENLSFPGSVEIGNIQILTPDSEVAETEETTETCITDCEDEELTENAIQVPLEAVNVLPAPELAMQTLERQLTEEVSDYLGLEDSVGSTNSTELANLPMAQNSLRKVQGQTGKRPALIYAVFGSGETADDAENILQQSMPSDKLELLLVTGDGPPKYIQMSETRAEVLQLAHRFRRQVASPSRVGTQSYLPIAQALYQLLIEPLVAELNAQEIDTISFITDAGLRSLPLAALHDGESFLIENYNIGLMPSLSLTDLTYKDIRDVGALVAGTSVFPDQVSLPSVPVELKAISSRWRSALLEGNSFNLDTLKGERQTASYGILHLATHGEFNPGDLSKSYLHLHNEKLGLDQLRTLGLHKPGVELITLSACQTALGSRAAELGFAGFAILTGAKTAVASLWNISDDASAGLMIEFYQQLQESQPTIKAEALRQAQLAMLRGKITVENGQLKLPSGNHSLPAGLGKDAAQDFSHPYYWAAFNLVGSPW